MTRFDQGRREAVEAGYATLAHLSRGRHAPDAALIAWAKAHGRYVRITRPVSRYPWGNRHYRVYVLLTQLSKSSAGNG